MKGAWTGQKYLETGKYIERPSSAVGFKAFPTYFYVFLYFNPGTPLYIHFYTQT